MILLKEEEIYPTDDVLERVLGASYATYKTFISLITGEDYKLDIFWRYYNDGKAWLCKVSYRQKTILWLSVWDTYFKLSFYFTEKTREGVMELAINQTIKDKFSKTEKAGKLIALIIDVKNEEQLENVLRIVEYKKSLK